MTLIAIFTLLFTLFALIYWALGMYAATFVHTQDDYFLAGRSLGTGALTGTLLATQLGGGMILGTAAHAYQYGWAGILYSLGMCCGFLLLGLGVASRFRRFSISTTAELFEVVYGSKRLRKVVSLLSMITLCGLFVAQIVASRALLHGLGVQSNLLFITFWGTLVVYTMFGGLPAVIITDLLQVGIIFTVFGGAFGWLWYVMPAQCGALFRTIPSLDHLIAPLPGGYWWEYIMVPVLFSLIEQDLAQRFFAARTERVAARSALYAASILALFSVIPVSIGLLARNSGLVMSADQSPLIVFLQAEMPVVLYALILCALIAAIASTADSLLCAITSHIVQDFQDYVPTVRGQERLAQVATLLVGVISLVVGFYFSDVLSVLLYSYKLLISAIAVPVVYSLVPAWCRRPRSAAGAGCAIITGCVLFFVVGLGTALCGAVIGYEVGIIVETRS